MTVKTVLITGGSEGIGFELAVLYGREGYRVLLAARNQEKLENAQNRLREMTGCESDVFVIDLSETGNAARLYDSVREKGYAVDELVNNAGTGYAGPFDGIDIEKDERLVLLNITALMTLSKLYAADMKARKSGLIVNMGSTGAFQPGPGIAAYYASKAFVVSYTRAMAYELKGSGVTAKVYCPGPVDTAFYQKSGGVMPPGAVSGKDAAEYLFQNRFSSRTVLIPGFVNQAAMLVPSSLRMRIVDLIKKELKKRQTKK